MRSFQLTLALAVVALLSADSTYADPDEPVGRFVAFSPLSQQQLYEKRMRFSGGEPMISVGIMERQAEVTLDADGPVRLCSTYIAAADGKSDVVPFELARAQWPWLGFQSAGPSVRSEPLAPPQAYTNSGRS